MSSRRIQSISGPTERSFLDNVETRDEVGMRRFGMILVGSMSLLCCLVVTCMRERRESFEAWHLLIAPDGHTMVASDTHRRIGIADLKLDHEFTVISSQ